MSSPLSIVLRKARSVMFLLRARLRSQSFGFSPSAIYGDSFYESEACLMTGRHADEIARILFDRFKPRSVFDFGCGRGWLLDSFRKLGVEAAGCEGASAGVRRCPSGLLVFQADLKRPVVLNRTYDLVTCIEVAEHLPARAAETLVASIAGAASQRVLFSASGPGEPGDDHINLQPEEYWLRLFAQHRFRNDARASEELRGQLRAIGAPEWYDNSLVLER